MNLQEEINRIKSMMGLLTEEDNDVLFDNLDWIRDVKPIPITSLSPGTKFKIVELGPKAIEDLNKDKVIKKYLKNGKIFKKKFIIDSEEGFYSGDESKPTDYGNSTTTDFWLIDVKGKLENTWINVDGVMVININ